MRGTLWSLAVAGAVVAASVVALPAAGETPDPSPWPETSQVDPGIDATAHSIRVAGPDRTQTALSAALLLRGAGSYPFGTSDRTSGPGVDLAGAGQWWGLGTCPFSVIVAAGDTAADSLAAASLSDPTDRSTEPQLVRTATSDEVLAPVGRTARVDTDSAPIVTTASTRQGATVLSPAARQAVADLAQGGCESVRSAIVVGGTNAVPAEVESQLLGLGVDQVFRISGPDRYGTAAAIARALGTGTSVTSTTPCTDAVVTDGDARMGFHGNAAIELRTSPTTCEVLDRTVVLADGATGADALAAGWWTSTWQVPVVLADAEGDLPAATRSALASMVVDNVVVLGGPGRIPDATVELVRAVTGATVHRVAGADRYETSVRMAGAFGGWFPTGDGADHDGSLVCLASSSGTGQGSVGWPDALGAGPWCAAAGGLASAVPAPVRGLTPVAGPAPRTTRGVRPSHDAVPILLAPAGGVALPDAVGALLGGSFDPADGWCTSLQPAEPCLDPGFAIAFGGSAVLTEEIVAEAARAVSGHTYVGSEDRLPTAQGGFWTELDLGPVYADGGVDPSAVDGRTCVDRSTLTGVRWLSAYAGGARDRFLAEHDLLPLGGAPPAIAGSQAANPPACVTVARDGPHVESVATSVSGSTTPIGSFDTGDEHRVELSGAVVHDQPEGGEGTDTLVPEPDGTTTVLSFTTHAAPEVAMGVQGQLHPVSAASAEIVILRATSPGQPHRFAARVHLDSDVGRLTATASGEAVFAQDVWSLRGRTTLGAFGDAAGGSGGFWADLRAEQTDLTDDRLAWRIDGLTSSATERAGS